MDGTLLHIKLEKPHGSPPAMIRQTSHSDQCQNIHVSIDRQGDGGTAEVNSPRK